MPLENIHLTLLKELIDELIVNSGIIKVSNPERVVEKVKFDFLVKLAFRFYSKLYNSEKYASYLYETINKIKNKDEYDHAVFQSLMNEIQNDTGVSSVQCLNCNATIPTEELIKSGENMPLCQTCKDHIGLEIDIWEKVFGDQ